MNPETGLENFLNSLKNYEKSRNKNHFQNYTTDIFYSVLKEFIYDILPGLRISVVGTNGKGSVSYYLGKIFSKNESIGLYTSPHIFDFSERIQFNFSNISKEWIYIFLKNQNEKKLDLLRELSYFEFLTLISFIFFNETKPGVLIYEAGLGGRLDATKFIFPEIVVVTKIDLDHMEILGDTKEKILNEKLGIISRYTKKIFLLHDNDFSEEYIRKKISSYISLENVEIYIYDKSPGEFKTYLEYNFNYSKFIYNHIYKEEKINLSIPEFNDLPLPKGRLEILKSEPLLIYDTAHNPSAIIHFLLSIEKSYRLLWNICIGVLPEKDLHGILHILIESRIIKQIYLLCFPPFQISELGDKKIISLQTENDLDRIDKYNPLLITGSFRLRQMFDNF